MPGLSRQIPEIPNQGFHGIAVKSAVPREGCLWRLVEARGKYLDDLEKSMNVIVSIGQKGGANAFIMERATEVLDFYGL